jgi:hypothetical protein
VLDLPPQVRPGQTAPLAAYLVVEDAARLAGGLTPYVELVDANGARRTAVTRGGLLSEVWQSGDLLLQQMSLTVPVDLTEGDYELRVGLAVDEAATSSASAATVATARVRAEP